MATCYEYEVELKVTVQKTKKSHLAKRNEFAYSVIDAAMLAIFNQSAVEPGGAESVSIVLVHIGPVETAIWAASEESRASIAASMKRISDLTKEVENR